MTEQQSSEFLSLLSLLKPFLTPEPFVKAFVKVAKALAAVMQASAAVRRMYRSLHSPSPVLATAEVIISNWTIAVETLPDTRTVCKGGESVGGSDAGFSGSEEAAYKLSQPFPGDSHDAGRHCIPTRCSCTIPGPLNIFFRQLSEVV